MTARVGKNGAGKTTTKESKDGEANHTKWVKEIISEYSSDFSIDYSMTIDDIVGAEFNEFAHLKNGKSSVIKSDGGFIKYKNKKVIGVCEHKYQKAIENACQRGLYYLGFLHDYQLFLSTSGAGFSEEKMTSRSTATARFVAIAKFGYKHKGLERGIGVSHNENEEEFKKTFRDWFEYLISKVV